MASRGLALLLIPLLAWVGLPRLVDRSGLVRANARLDSTDAASQALGPALGGGLVGLLGAPVAIVVDAVSYLVEAVLVASIRVDEPRPERSQRHLLGEVADGLPFTYAHPVLGRLALATHLWFVANGAATTALSLLALRRFGLSAAAYGLVMATLGVATLVGAALAPQLGKRIGAGRAVVAARALVAVVAVFALAALVVARRDVLDAKVG